MKRRFVLAAAIAFAGVGALTIPAVADSATASDPGSEMKLPVPYTPRVNMSDTRHVCVIVDWLNKSWCLYIPFPA